MQTADFDFFLPPGLIAQTPARERDQSRLLVLNRGSGGVMHEKFPDLLNYLKPGDVLVLNNSAVIPARLRGVNTRTGGRFEILLLEEVAVNDWWVMLRPGKRARIGTEMEIQNNDGTPAAEHAIVTGINDEGHRRLRFSGAPDIRDLLDALGETPLPPYITRANTAELAADKSRYQTVYAEPPGSVAAPTAGLHFTVALLDEIRARGVRVCFVTLHVGLGTFAPVKARTLSTHTMHEERYELDDETARAVNEAKHDNRRVVAVGTTTVRVLESVASQNGGRLVSGAGRTRIFIYPPFQFQIVDALLTNFHLPRSTLLMLVSAFAAPGDIRGREMVLSAYVEAVRGRYRFFSYGDAMLIV
jgi:S-adenosylmethionine:tRNA ribosyltransferase-isomerase